MLWPLLPVVILGLAAVLIHKSRFRSGLRFAVASLGLLYFVIAAATVSTRKAPYIFFALLALGILIEEVWRRKQGMQAPRT
ncbi:MAG: hypothetical protein GXP48_00970 [Acidobacteria bacterium]|nr:hypothetical protein [Acidobacteriota bacterium]